MTRNRPREKACTQSDSTAGTAGLDIAPLT